MDYIQAAVNEGPKAPGSVRSGWYLRCTPRVGMTRRHSIVAIVAGVLGATIVSFPIRAQEHAPPAADQAPPPDVHAPPAPAPAGDAPPPAAQAPPAAPSRADAPPPPAAPNEAAASGVEVTPVRLSYVYGNDSFWRPGADDWSPAQINTPLSPGDQLYAPAKSSLELQIGGRAFVRAGPETQLGLENQESDYLQLKIPAGHMSIDLRSIKAGQAIEIDTPNAEFTVTSVGYYRVDVTDDTTTFVTRRSGHGTVTPAGGQTMSIAASEEVAVQGNEQANVATYAAPELDEWDRWNYARTDHLLESVSARYVNANEYGVDELDHYGNWRVTDTHGPVWFPSQVSTNWTPYSDGRWVWDATYGWSWVDAAPWGWAPCHYGRWVNESGYWGWAPGPIVSAPVYAPAVVAFIGGANFGVSIGIGAAAVGWVPLGWGEPIVPWWGRAGFVGVPTWGGWGGPRVVNNVVINRTTIINANTINRYENAGVRNAVVATREADFGRGVGQHVHVQGANLQRIEPINGRLPMQPAAASLSPKLTRGARPPEQALSRQVVATRAPRDNSAALRDAGLKAAPKQGPAPRLVSVAKGNQATFSAPRAPFGQSGNAERAAPGPPPEFGRTGQAPQRQLQSRGAPPPSNVAAPPAKSAVPRNLAPAARGNAPAHPNAAAPPEQRVSIPRQTAPRQAEPRQAAPRQAAPQNIPRAAAPPPQPRHAAVPATHETRELPGGPANRLYRAQPPTRNAEAAPQNARPQKAPPPQRLGAQPKHAPPQRLSGGHHNVQ